jgi:GNAT superfamily N-acetyltransferase
MLAFRGRRAQNQTALGLCSQRLPVQIRVRPPVYTARTCSSGPSCALNCTGGSQLVRCGLPNTKPALRNLQPGTRRHVPADALDAAKQLSSGGLGRLRVNPSLIGYHWPGAKHQTMTDQTHVLDAALPSDPLGLRAFGAPEKPDRESLPSARARRANGTIPTRTPMIAADWHAWVPVRRLEAKHRRLVREHLLALSHDDLVLRFGHAVTPTQLERYASSLDFESDEVFGVFNRRLCLVALGHLALDTQAAVGELGLSVLSSTRGRGLGRQLFTHAARLARNRGAHELVLHIAANNAGMLAIIQRAGATLTQEGSEVTARLALDGATWGTQLEARVEAQVAAFDFRLKLELLRADRRRSSIVSRKDATAKPTPECGGASRSSSCNISFNLMD